MDKSKYNMIYLLLAFCIALTLSTALVYIRKQMVKERHLVKREAVQKEKREYIYTLLDDIYEAAERYNDETRDAMVKELQETYNSAKEFDKDFDSTEMNKLNDIQTKYSRGYFSFMNDIGEDKSDNNDNFMSDFYKIREDGSGNCMAFGRSRTHEQEATQHFNSKLALLAAEDLNKKMKRRTFWLFLNVPRTYPWYLELKEFESTDLSYLKEVFEKYDSDIRFFRSFEFITRASINEVEDIFGRKFIKNGVYNERSKIININQGFNLLDQINANPVLKDRIDRYDEEIQNLDREFLSSISVYNFFILILFLIFLWLFLHTASLRKG